MTFKTTHSGAKICTHATQKEIIDYLTHRFHINGKKIKNLIQNARALDYICITLTIDDYLIIIDIVPHHMRLSIQREV